MGKAKKEHRKKIAKRNEKLAQAKRSFDKKITQLRTAFAEVMDKKNRITEITEDQANAELVDGDVSSEFVKIKETSDEKLETKGE